MRRSFTSLLASAAGVSMLLGAIAAPVYAKEENKEGKTADIACVQTAVDARESAIDTAWGTFTKSMTSAYAARKSALHYAWSLTDAKARKDAIRGAWKAFKKATKAARKQWMSDRKAAWEVFKTAKKSCNTKEPGDEGGQGLRSEERRVGKECRL